MYSSKHDMVSVSKLANNVVCPALVFNMFENRNLPTYAERAIHLNEVV